MRLPFEYFDDVGNVFYFVIITDLIDIDKRLSFVFLKCCLYESSIRCVELCRLTIFWSKLKICCWRFIEWKVFRQIFVLFEIVQWIFWRVYRWIDFDCCRLSYKDLFASKRKIDSTWNFISIEIWPTTSNSTNRREWWNHTGLFRKQTVKFSSQIFD